MKFRRRSYIVNPKLQIRFSLLFALIALIGNICAVIIFNTFAIEKLDAVIWSTHVSIKTTDELLTPLFIYVNSFMFLFMIVLFIITGLWMIRKSSGPLYRMSKDIKRITEGDLSTSVSLRGNDEFQDVADTLDDMTDKLRLDFISIRDIYSNITQAIHRIDTPVKHEEEISRDCDDILKSVSDLELKINKFQTS